MKVATVHICRSWGKSLLLAPNDSCDSTTANSLTAISETNIQFHLACIASISVWLQSEERGMRVKDRAKNGASKRAGGGGDGKKGFLPLPPLSFFGSCSISRSVKTKNPVPRSFFALKPNGNACYAVL